MYWRSGVVNKDRSSPKRVEYEINGSAQPAKVKKGNNEPYADLRCFTYTGKFNHTQTQNIMAKIQDYSLLVSGLGGTVYIAKKTKQPNIMSADRVKVPEGEFINAVVTWAVSKIQKGKGALVIQDEDGPIAEITITRKSLLKK